MAYIYVDESGELSKGDETTWVAAAFDDPFAAHRTVNGAWASGASLLREIRRWSTITTAVVPSLSGDKRKRVDPEALAVLDRVGRSIPEKVSNECHTQEVVQTLRLIGGWTDPSCFTSTIRHGFGGVGTIAVPIARQGALCSAISPLAAYATTGKKRTGWGSQTRTLIRLYDMIVALTGTPRNDEERFPVMLAALASGVRESIVQVQRVGIATAIETRAVKVTSTALPGFGTNRAAPAAIAATIARMCQPSSTATVIIDGAFSKGMRFKDVLNRSDKSLTVTGVVPANSVGTALLWVPDTTAFALSNPTTTFAADDYAPVFTSLVRSNTHLDEITTPEEWASYVSSPVDVTVLSDLADQH